MLIARRDARPGDNDQRGHSRESNGMHIDGIARLLLVDERRQVRINAGAFFGDVGIGRGIGMQQAISYVSPGFGTEKARQRHRLRRNVHSPVGVDSDGRRGGLGVSLRPGAGSRQQCQSQAEKTADGGTKRSRQAA